MRSGGDAHDVVVGEKMDESCGCIRLVRYARRMSGPYVPVPASVVFLSVSV